MYKTNQNKCQNRKKIRKGFPASDSFEMCICWGVSGKLAMNVYTE